MNKKASSRSTTTATCLALWAFAAPGAGNATEGGGTIKVLGPDTILSGVMPPPGLMVKTVTVNYEADRTLDGSGNARAGISDFNLHVRAGGIHFQYAWPRGELWNAKLMTSLATGYIDLEIAFDVTTPSGRIPRRDSTHGMTDTLFGPVLLGWQHGNFHHIAGPQYSLDTGAFNPARLANAGRGYQAFVPYYAFTWFPVEGAELSAGSFYIVNRRNPETGYRSGRELVVDYGAAYQVRPGLQVGAAGYLYKQVSDDVPSGPAIPGGNRGQVFAIGPFARVHGRGWGLSLKWQRESAVENRASGHRILLQGALKL